GLCGTKEKIPAGGFPLLVKLMDAKENLSVQVHPDDSLARELHGPEARGKGEAWVVLEAKPDQVLYNGFKSGTTWADVERALGVGRVVDLMNAVRVKAGDVVDVPAGRPHALGAGCLVAEVQQNSDHTYRLWDWGRLERGKARTLHLQEARRALNFGALGCGDGLTRPQPFRENWGLREALLSTPYFNLERWTLKPGAGPSGAGCFWLLLAVSGNVHLRWRGLGASGAGLSLRAGLSVLVPAGLPLELCAGSTGAVLLGAGLGPGQQA
ncbi:MAG: type I phosphomannose isomerase catalytic subunit, partial [bacterium]